MNNLLINKRIKLLLGKSDESKDEQKVQQSKNVYAYMDKKLIAQYDSITKCGNALGLTRLMVRKAIENEVELENGLRLSLTKLNF